MFRGPRDRLVGVSVSVKQGPHKAHFGVIKDVNGSIARVELQTGNKVITIDKSKLWRRKYVLSHDHDQAHPPYVRFSKDGTLEGLENHGQGGGGRGGDNGFGPRSFGQNSFNLGDRNPYNQSNFNEGGRTPLAGKTPAWGGRTPMHPPSDSRTPAWNVSRTPNPYAAGGKTPAWNAQAHTPAWGTSSRTPNPYPDGGAGGRTPAWNAGANPSTRDPHGLARTPAQIGQPLGWNLGSGGETPRWNSDRTDTAWAGVSHDTSI